jgi:calcium-dependent protein kinase
MGCAQSVQAAPGHQKCLVEATESAEARVGRTSVQGRYHRLPKRIDDDYIIKSEEALGEGYNGSVYLATNKTTGRKFAVKAFKLSGVDETKKSQLATEAGIYLSMDHPHVARLVDVYESEHTLSLVMECCEGGELFDRVSARKRFTEVDAADSTVQMLLAVNYLHSCGVVHRDLKLENFLYEKKAGEGADFLKLIDFGFSKIWEKNTKMELSCGTLSYVAPEVLSRSYTSQCDLWSLGVIVFILLAGYMPFTGSEGAQIDLIRDGKFKMKKERWEKVSTLGFDFVKKLLVTNPKVRLTAPQALQHPWITDRAGMVTRRNSLNREVVDGLCAFAYESQFRRACMHLMAWSLTVEERAEVREAFLELDVNKTGTITVSEMKQVLEAKFDFPEDEAMKVFKALDTENSNEIHYSEFLGAMVSSRIALHDDLLKSTFRRFDMDNSGFITHEDLRKVLGVSVCLDGAVKDMDQDKDGKISCEEFIAYLRNNDATIADLSGAERIIDRESAKQSFKRANSPIVQRIRKRDKLRMFGSRVWGSLTSSHSMATCSSVDLTTCRRDSTDSTPRSSLSTTTGGDSGQRSLSL